MSAARQARSDDEGGAVLLLVSLAVVVLMVSAAFSIDLGALAATNRRLQGVADLAAIAASNQLDGHACNFSVQLSNETVPRSLFDRVRGAAVTSAATNGHVVGGSKTLVVEVGVLSYDSTTGAPKFVATHSTLTGADCMVSSTPAAVRVTAGDYTKYSFGPAFGQAGRTSTRSAIGGRRRSPGQPACTPNNCPTGTTLPTTNTGTGTGTETLGAFRIGSSVANLNTANSPILTSVLDSMLCPVGGQCHFDVSLVGYQGLAAANVTLGQLKAQLGAGSMTSLMTSSIKASDLYLASAKALGCTQVAGCTNAAAVTLLGLSGTVTSSGTFKLSNLITIAAGSETTALATAFNVLDLVTGSAAVINGTNFINVPITTVAIPGGGTNKSPCGAAAQAATCLSLKLIEGPQSYVGPVGGFTTTSQATVKVEQDVNLLNIPVLGSLNLSTITGKVTMDVTAGSAKGTLTQAGCTPTLGETVTVDTTGATTTIGGTLSVNVVTSTSTTVAGTSSVAGVSGVPVAFSYPTEYPPDTTSPKHVGGTNLNVQGKAVSSSLATVDAAALTTALTGQTGALTTLDTSVISPVLSALGVDVASADVWAMGAPNCVPIVLG